ncbi:MAG: cell division protein FtsZ [Candidatus Micrarchaeia archaeon]
MQFEEMFSKGGSPITTIQKNTIVSEPNKQLSEDDQELLKLLEQTAPKITVIGTGGSGCNTITRIQEIGIIGTKIIAMNTDAQHLLNTNANKKLVLGRKRTRGMGAGSNPEIGEASAQESAEEIKATVTNTDLVFVTCGMGGGTGTGSAHVIAKAAKESGALVVAIVTAPFTSEGVKRAHNAKTGIEKLKREADTTIVIPNEKLLYYVPDLPLNAAFKAADTVLANAVKGIAELITKPGLVNLDFADIRTILQESGQAMIGLGEIEETNKTDRVTKAAENALSSPFLDVDVSSANKALVNITGGSDMTLGEAEAAVSLIANKISKEAHIIWGAAIDENLQNRGVRVLAVLSGIKDLPDDSQKEENLDLEFI